MVLPTGTCQTCSATDQKLRPNPFHNDETPLLQCEECRSSHPEHAIIGVTELKKQLKLKDEDLEGLQMAKEAKPKFLGGPDKRWFLLKEVEARAEKVLRARGQELERKKEEKEEKQKEKEEKLAEKEKEKAEKQKEKEDKLAEKEREKAEKQKEREDKLAEKEKGKAEKEKDKEDKVKEKLDKVGKVKKAAKKADSPPSTEAEHVVKPKKAAKKADSPPAAETKVEKPKKAAKKADDPLPAVVEKKESAKRKRAVKEVEPIEETDNVGTEDEEAAVPKPKEKKARATKAEAAPPKAKKVKAPPKQGSRSSGRNTKQVNYEEVKV